MILNTKFRDNPSFANSKKINITLLHEETSETEFIKFVGSYAALLNDSIYVVTNISVEIFMHIQTFILVIHYKTGDQGKYKYSLKTGTVRAADILMKAMKNLVIIASRFWTRYLIEQIYLQTFAMILPAPSCLHMWEFSSTHPQPISVSATVILEC